jgi:hypothetical protein
MEGLIQLLFLVTLVTHTKGYRQMHFTNADVCASDESTKNIQLGDGSLILSLNNQSFASFNKLKEEKKICNIKITTIESKQMHVCPLSIV